MLRGQVVAMYILCHVTFCPFTSFPRLFLFAMSAINFIKLFNALSLTVQSPPVLLLDTSIVTALQFAFQLLFAHAVFSSSTYFAISPLFPIP